MCKQCWDLVPQLKVGEVVFFTTKLPWTLTDDGIWYALSDGGWNAQLYAECQGRFATFDVDGDSEMMRVHLFDAKCIEANVAPNWMRGFYLDDEPGYVSAQRNRIKQRTRRRLNTVYPTIDCLWWTRVARRAQQKACVCIQRHWRGFWYRKTSLHNPHTAVGQWWLRKSFGRFDTEI